MNCGLRSGGLLVRRVIVRLGCSLPGAFAPDGGRNATCNKASCSSVCWNVVFHMQGDQQWRDKGTESEGRQAQRTGRRWSLDAGSKKCLPGDLHREG